LEDPGHVAARPTQTRNEPELHRVATDREDDRNRGRCLLGGERRVGAADYHYPDLPTGQIAPGSRQTLYQPHGDRVAASNKNDRNFVGRLGGGERLRRTNRKDDINAELDKLLGELRKTLLAALRVAPLNKKVLTFGVT